MLLKNGQVRAVFASAARWIAGNAYMMSALEVMFALVVTNITLLVAMFVYLLMSSEGSANLVFDTITRLREEIKTTEIVVYILGFLAPALWIIVSNARVWKHTYFMMILLIVQGGVIFSIGLVYALSLAEVVQNQALANVWVLISLAAALLVWYVTLVYHKKVLLHLERKIERPTAGRESGSAVLAGLGDDE